MLRYWIIAPYDSQKPDIFENAWSYDLKHNTIAVGWKELPDASKFDKNKLEEKFKETFPHVTNKGNITRDVNTIWNFLHEISIGDIILARKGTKKLIGKGIVKGTPFYDVTAGRERVGNLTENYYPYLIPVEWEQKDISYPDIVFSFYTMYEIGEDKYRELLPPPEATIQQSPEFVLEKYLEEFIISNFDKIFKNHLGLYKDTEGNIGQQFIIDSEGKQIGRIDILAKDTQSGNFVVIELKKGRESDQVIGQLLRYMGWIKENLCEPNQEVKGYVVCKDIDERLRLAISIVADKIKIKRYKIDFQLIDN
jgi:hypothetical protein